MIGKFLKNEDFIKCRKRLLQMHFKSNVGHVGGNLSALDAMLVIFNEYLTSSDRFILSKGHSAGALYIAIWSVGRLTDADLDSFHQESTLLAGHPPAKGLADVLFATGSLGHGLSLAAGTALGFKLRNQSGQVICMTSDGEWQEGSIWEALIFAVHHRLKNLTVLVDHNDLQGFGSTNDVASMSPLWERLKGFDLDLKVVDGHDPNAIRVALDEKSDKIKVIVLCTIKGKGVDFLEGRMDSHYLPLSKNQFEESIRKLSLL